MRRSVAPVEADLILARPVTGPIVLGALRHVNDKRPGP